MVSWKRCGPIHTLKKSVWVWICKNCNVQLLHLPLTFSCQQQFSSLSRLWQIWWQIWEASCTLRAIQRPNCLLYSHLHPHNSKTNFWRTAENNINLKSRVCYGFLCLQIVCSTYLYLIFKHVELALRSGSSRKDKWQMFFRSLWQKLICLKSSNPGSHHSSCAQWHQQEICWCQEMFVKSGSMMWFGVTELILVLFVLTFGPLPHESCLLSF